MEQDQPNPSQPSSPLEDVVDDDEPVQDCFNWLLDEMSNGRTVEDLLAEMVENGWARDEAEELTEAARRRTRHLRGVVTRQQVVKSSERRYRKSMRAALHLGALGGLGLVFGLIASVIHFPIVLFDFIAGRTRKNPKA